MCWNAQHAFRNTGLDHDGANPLTIPATVTSIEYVSERARSSTAPLRVRRASLSACAERPASPSPSHVCSLVDRGAPDEAYAPSS